MMRLIGIAWGGRRLLPACLRRPSAWAVLLFLAVFPGAPPAYSEAATIPRVLLITSYHQGDAWNDEVVKGVRDVLGGIPDISLGIEHLDMRRHGGDVYRRDVKKFLRAKHQARRHDLIIVSDDAALDFMLAVREELFPGIPVVFCGINNFTPARIGDDSHITGVNEAVSLVQTLDLALQLFPDTAAIYVVASDLDANGRAHLAHFREVAAGYSHPLAFIELLNLRADEAPHKLRQLPSNSLVLRLSSLPDQAGGFISLRESMRMLSAHAPVPVLTAWEFDLGEGALGGVVICGEEQGRAAGELAAEILRGKSPADLAVVMESPNVPMFDYRQMERFGVSAAALPPGAVILHRPFSAYQEYKAWIWLAISVTGLLSGMVLVLLLAIARRKRAETRLRESEEKFRSIFESMTDMAALHELVFDAQGEPVNYRIMDCNPAFTRLTGIWHEAAAGRLATDVYPTARAPYLDEFARVALTGEPHAFTTYFAPLDRHLEIHAASPGKNKFLTLIADITERKRAEEERSRFIAILENTVHLIAMSRPDERLAYLNPAGRRMIGWADGEPLEEHGMADLHPAWAFEEITRHGLPAALQKGCWQGETALLHRDGREIPVSQVILAHKTGEGGEVVYYSTLMLDLRGLKEAEEARRRISILESLGTVAGGIAHDFNNLLMGVFGNLELALLDLPENHPALAALKSASHALEQSRRLTTRLLTFAKGGDPMLETLDLRELICETVRFQLAGSKVAARFDISEDLCPAKADKGQIVEVLANLAINAREAMPDGGILHVEAKPDRHDEAIPLGGEYIRIVFRDEGHGIPEQVLGKIFEPYFTTKEKGTGLGLAVTHSIISKHGGHLSVASTPGSGTAFTLLLPADITAKTGTRT